MKQKSIQPLLIGAVFTLLLIGCGGGLSDTDSEATVEAKAALTTKPTWTPEPKQNSTLVPPAGTEPSTDPGLDLRFSAAVDEYVKNSWSTWSLGDQMGHCFIVNGPAMTKESKEAVIKHGIEEAFGTLVGAHVQSLSAVWNLCESKATTSPDSPIVEPSAVTATTASVPILNFESTIEYEEFDNTLQAQFQDTVDEYFDAATEKAGISVAAYDGGSLWRYAKGKASSSAEMTVGTPTLIRSTSKTFLAGLVLQQIDEGLYSLSDTLGSVMSGNPDYEALDKNVINPDVTIEQLLTMTSGIENVKDYYRPEIAALQESQNWRPVDVVQLVITNFRQPGTYQYSNTNSMLLGLVAEHAGRRQLSELYKSVFFDPLGIVAVLLPQDAPPPNSARPHGDRSQWGGVGFGDIMENSHHGTDWYGATNKTTWAAAGMITTPENMARWAYELLSDQGSALSSTARGSLLDSFSGPLISIGGPEPEHRYGYHVTRTTLSLSGNSITAYGHPGSGGGYVSDVFYSPELDMSISLLVNSHSDARSRVEAQGKITHRTLGEIAQQVFEAYKSK